MADAERGVKIKVDVEADASKAQAVESVIAKLKEQTTEAADAQKDLNTEASAGAQVLDTLGSRTGAARDVIEGLDQASKGGMNSVFGLARAAKNFMEVISLTNPIARIVSLIAALGGGVYVLIKRFGDVKKPIEDAGAAASDAADEFEKLEQLKIEGPKNAVEEIAASLKSASADAEQLRERLASLEDANLAKNLAEIDLAVANGELSKEDASFLKASQIADSENRKLSLEENTLRSERSRLTRTKMVASGELSEAELKFNEAQAARDSASRIAGGMSEDDALKRLKQKEFDAKEIERLAGLTGRLDLKQQMPIAAEQARQAREQYDAVRNLPSLESRLVGASLDRDRAQAVFSSADRELSMRSPEIDNRLAIIGLGRETSAIKFGTAQAERFPGVTPKGVESGKNATALTIDQLRDRAVGAVLPIGETPQGVAGGDVGRATQAKGREIIANAYKIAQDTSSSDEEVSAMLNEILAAFKNVGARYAKQDAAMQQIRKELETINGQFKNGGVR